VTSAQTPPPGSSPPAPPGAASKPAGADSAEAIPLADIPDQADRTRRMLRDLTAGLPPSLAVRRIEGNLPDIEKELHEFADQTVRTVTQTPRAGDLYQLDRFWRFQNFRLDGMLEVLTQRSRAREEEIRRLDTAEKQWRATLKTVDVAGSPEELRARVRGTIVDIDSVSKDVKNSQNDLLELQNRVVHLQGVAADVLRSIQAAQGLLRERMLQQDAPPLWAGGGHALEAGFTGRTVGGTVSQRWAALRRFTWARALPLSLRLLLLLIVWFAARRLSSKVREWVSKEPELLPLEPFFRRPLALALFVTLLSLIPLFPLAPTAFETLLAGLLCVTNLRLLLPVARPVMRPFLIVPGLLLLADRFRGTFQDMPPERFLLLIETVLAMAGVLWLIRVQRRGDTKGAVVIPGVAFSILSVTLLGLIVSIAANFAGYLTLAIILGQGMVLSLFLATFLFGVVWITRILFRALLLTNSNRALLLPPSVEELLYQRGSLLLGLAAFTLWVLLTLDLFVVRDVVIGWVSLALTTPLQVRGFGVTPGDILLAFVVVAAAFAIAGMIRTILQDGVLPVLPLQRGLPHTISTLTYYVVLLIGFLAAAAASGVDIDKFTLFASAFSVGLGFGLQNVVNNFVSGLILLFERPIQMGDTVELGPLLGAVRRIGLRSISVQTPQGSEVIVPNSNLVNAQLINWTRSDTMRRVDLPVSVGPGPQPGQVIEILQTAAAGHPHVLREPAPEVLITKLGKDALNFELRVWTPQEQFEEARSELVLAISEAMQAAEIPLL
jgi:small-conductance mechanosensitive channel